VLLFVLSIVIVAGPTKLKVGSRLVGNRIGKAVGRYVALQEEFHKRGMSSEVSKVLPSVVMSLLKAVSVLFVLFLSSVDRD
jgi:hypothetical protein